MHRCACIFLALLGLATSAAAVAPEQVERVDSYLGRLELSDLQIHHWEWALDRADDENRRRQWAAKLAEAYARRLVRASHEADIYAQTQQKLAELVERFPAIDSPGLRITRLEAQYRQAEKLMTDWLADASKEELLQQARESLRRLAPALDRSRGELNAQIDELSRFDPDKPADEAAAEEAELEETQSQALRAAYFAGWANYYLGLSRGSRVVARSDYEAARDAFRDMLEIGEAESYEGLDAEWLGVESLWRSRAVLGLGMTETALGNLEASAALFRFVEHPSAPPEIRDHAATWQVQGLLHAGHLEEAQAIAREALAGHDSRPTAGKVSLAAALVRAGRFDDGRSALRGELAEVGFRYLAQSGQFSALQELLDEAPDAAAGSDGFYIAWVRGQRMFDQAESKKEPEQYAAAADMLADALAMPGAQADPKSAAQCRYTLGWCLYRMGEHQRAADAFSQAMTVLREQGLESAAQAQWMTFVCLQKLSEQGKAGPGAAMQALLTLKREFPEHRRAQQADYYLAKLQQTNADPASAIRTLERIDRGDSNYALARFEICLLRHRQWRAKTGGGTEASDEADALYAAVDEYLALNDDHTERKLKASLLAVEAALQAHRDDLAERYLQAGSAWAESLPAENEAVVERRYRLLQLARQRNDAPAQRRQAQWLVDHAHGTPFEKAGLIIAAKELDAAIAEAEGAERTERLREGVEIYQRLVDLLGADADQIAASRNALAANSKLAQYEYELERYAAASRRLAAIVKAYPRERKFLRRAGLAAQAAGDYPAALEYWRTVLRGAAAGSDDWYEAKHHQIANLAHVDRPQAKRVFEQFRLLHPDVESEAWRRPFQELEASLAAGASP